MQRQAVESGLIFAIGYDSTTQTLEVEFHKSKKQDVNPVYSYSPFPPERFAEFAASQKSSTNPEGSVGKYFLEKIKRDASLAVARVSPEQP